MVENSFVARIVPQSITFLRFKYILCKCGGKLNFVITQKVEVIRRKISDILRYIQLGRRTR